MEGTPMNDCNKYSSELQELLTTYEGLLARPDYHENERLRAVGVELWCEIENQHLLFCTASNPVDLEVLRSRCMTSFLEDGSARRQLELETTTDDGPTGELIRISIELAEGEKFIRGTAFSDALSVSVYGVELPHRHFNELSTAVRDNNCGVLLSLGVERFIPKDAPFLTRVCSFAWSEDRQRYHSLLSDPVCLN